ncbi:alpha/beta hydrolase [Profundibacter amoris]|uniref:Alpha/beta hydrolase n=1 Tax=Profundibacter amoris TaxID=2171755 RepID=A0A347UHV3_9RHOB|nr:alpha/beta hydrolase [Profundibacter amoris]AXX98431.1 alpha/beta hydrolase [Profundibacter amoris]
MILKTLGITALLGLTSFGLLGKFEQSMVYPLDPTEVSPANAGVPQMQAVRFTSDKETLVLWVAKPKAGKPVILYFQGNAGNLANRAPRFASFQKRGYGVVAMAYRGSSGSSGKPSQKSILRDAINLYQSLPNLVGDAPVVLYGESLGTGVAVLMADNPKLANTPPAAMVLEAPYTSLPDITRRIYPKFKPILFLMKNRWPSLRHIRNLDIPLLVLHGTDDPLIPIEMGREMFDASPATDNTFFAVQGAGHNDVWQTDAKVALYAFLNRF